MKVPKLIKTKKENGKNKGELVKTTVPKKVEIVPESPTMTPQQVSRNMEMHVRMVRLSKKYTKRLEKVREKERRQRERAERFCGFGQYLKCCA